MKKRTASRMNDGASTSTQAAATDADRRTKRSRTSNPQSEPEFFEEQRELEDLWKQAFPVGTEDAFEEGGVLHQKKVYLFTSAEPQLLFFEDISKITCIPAVVAVVSPFPPSNKVAHTSVYMASEEIIDMKQMKMDWVPYIPLGKRDSSPETLETQIFVLSCVQRRAGLKHLNLERVKRFEYCLPYIYNPLEEDEIEQSTIVHILYPVEPEPVVCEFDWELDELEEFTNQFTEVLSKDQMDGFKEFVREKVREKRKANREEKERRRRAREELSEERVAAFGNMKVYKFYPVATPDTPDISAKESFINRYYGKAHQVF